MCSRRSVWQAEGHVIVIVMESDPQTVLKFVSKCMDIVETEAHAD